MQINLGEPSYDDNELSFIAEAIGSNWVAGQGPQSKMFEREFASYCGTDDAVAVNNCTAALHLILTTYGIGPGDEVIVADYTYPATGHSVLYTRATPRFCDVRVDTGTIDVQCAKELINHNTKAIIAVDVAGMPADYEELNDLAIKHNILLIQDAACSAGATYKGLRTGNPMLAHAAAFSFHGRKGITCGEGGALVMRSEEDLAIARSLSSFGVDSALNRLTSNDLVIPEFVRLGYNYKLSDIASAVMRAQLKKIDSLISRRREVASQYDAVFAHLEQVKPFPILDDRQSAYQSYVLTVDDRINRNKLIIALRKVGVGCNIGTFASHLQPIYKYTDTLPVSKKLFEQQIAIPMHGNMKDPEIEFVTEKVKIELNSKDNWR